MEKLTFTEVKNPFSPSDRKISQMPYREGASLASYIEVLSLESGIEYALSINGDPIPVDLAHAYVPQAWDWVTAVPVVHGGDGKNPLAIIASLLVPVVAMGVGSMLAGGAFMGSGFIGPASWGWSSILGATATMMIGGMLVNALFAPSAVDMPDPESDQVYRWGKMQPLMGQGYPVPILHGTVRTAGQILAEHVSTDGDNQYYNLLLCLAEGPVDEISGVMINDNPIDNFSDVWEHVRLGDNDQAVIEGFDDTYADQALSYVLDIGEDPDEVADVREARCDSCDHWHSRACTFKQAVSILRDDGSGRIYHPSRSTDPSYLCADYVERTWGPTHFVDTGESWATHQTEGDSGEGLEIVLDFSQGLFHTTDEGEQEETHVDVAAEYRLVGAPAWIPWVSERVAEKKTSAFQKAWRVDNVPAGRYEVRVRVVAKGGTSLRYANKVSWTMLSHIVYDDFVRPGKALLAVRALATDQLSGGRPNITALVTRSSIWAWNPETALYEAKAADNPAWATYDVLHRCRRLKDVNSATWAYEVQGVPASQLVYADFAAWAAFCDEKELKVNFLLGEATDLWSALQVYEDVGRGKALLRGTKWSCMWDGLSDPVQLFSVGNILKDSFQEEFLGLKDRANAVEVTYRNAAKGYEQDSLTVYDEGFDSEDNLANPTQIRMPGVTDFALAYRQAKFHIALNKYILRTCTWTADVDALACQVGDVVRLQHDVPQWGWGGRITGTDFQAGTTNLLPFDSVVNTAGRYVLPTLGHGTFRLSADVTVFPDDDATYRRMSLYIKYTDTSYAEAADFNIPKDGVKRSYTLTLTSDPAREVSEVSGWILDYSTSPGVFHASAEKCFLERSDEATPYVPSGVTRPDSDVLLLDREVTLEPGTDYAVMVRRNDDVLVEKPLFPVYETTTTDRVALTGYFAGERLNGDPSFELCEGGYTGELESAETYLLGDGWVAQARNCDATIEVVSPGRLSGKKIRITRGEISDWTGIWKTVNPALAGVTYRVSVWMRVSSASATDPISYALYCYPHKEYFTWPNGAPWDNPGEWKQGVVTFTQEDNESWQVYCKGYSSNAVPGDWWEFDDLHIEEVHDLEGKEVYSLGPVDHIGKDFRVIRVTKEGDLKVRLAGIEYVPEVYEEAVPPDEPETVTSTPVTNLRVSEHVDAQGTVFLDVSWTPPRGDYYGATVGINGKKVATLTQFETSYSMPVPASVSVVVKVSALNALGFARATAEATYAIQARTVPQVSGLALQEDSYILKDGTALSDVRVSWARPDSGHIRHFVVYYDLGDGVVQLGGLSTGDSFVLKALPAPETVAVSVAVVNSAGFAGVPVEADPLTLTGKSDPPPNVTGLVATVDPLDRGRYVLSWDEISLEAVPDLRGYVVRVGATWADGVQVGAILPEPKLGLEYDASGTYVYHVRALDNSGNVSTSGPSVSVIVSLEPAKPTDLALTLDATDKSWGTLAWTLSAGKDISGYEVRQGASWETATGLGETTAGSFRVRLASSGLKDFLVRARSRRGFLSNVTVLAVSVSLEPENVTGFAAEQREGAKNVIVLSWDAPADQDVSYYEIREGASWDSGSVVGAHVSGLFLEHRVSEERTFPWWIRAFSAAGHPSLDAASVAMVVGLVPTAPSDLVVGQDPYDRARVAISWALSPDSDVTGYEVRNGTAWTSAEVLGIAADPRLDLTLSASKEMVIKVRARNSSGFLSGEISAFLDATLEPSDVSGFQAAQDGATIDLLWEKVDEPDVVGYEVREGSSWATGAVLVTGLSQTGYVHPVATERTFRVHVKAITRAGFYSAVAASASVVVMDLPPKNVLQSWDEITLQSGVHDGTAFGSSDTTMATLGGQFDDYPTNRFNEAGAAEVLTLGKTYDMETADPLVSGLCPGTRFMLAAKHGGWGWKSTGTEYVSTQRTKTDALTYYRSEVKKVSVWVRMDAEVDNLNWAGLSALSYCAFADMRNNEGTAAGFQLRKGVAASLASDNEILVNQNVWYQVEIEFKGGDVIARLYSEGGDLLSELMEPNTEIQEGDVGIVAIGQSSFDDISILYEDQPQTAGTYTLAQKDLGRIVTANIGAEFIPSFVAAAGTKATLEYRTSRDNVTWTPWRIFSPRQETFRYLEGRVLLSTTDPAKTPEVGVLVVFADMPDVTKTGRASVSVGGSVIDFGYEFSEAPSLVVSADGADRRAEITAGPSTTQATVKVVNAAGADVGGTANWYAAGY